MGKRKSSSKPMTKKQREVLPSNFQCLFCNHENSVSVKLDKKISIGVLNCKVCGQQYQSSINYLSAAVDVYADWVDACEAVAKDGVDASAAPAGRTNYRGTMSKGRDTREEEPQDDGDGFIVNDEMDAEAEFDDDDA